MASLVPVALWPCGPVTAPLLGPVALFPRVPAAVGGSARDACGTGVGAFGGGLGVGCGVGGGVGCDLDPGQSCT